MEYLNSIDYPDIDWFEEYFKIETKEEKIKWLKEKHLHYVKGKNNNMTFTTRAHQFYGMLNQKLQELTNNEL
jgi:hypothetical protein